MNVYSVPTRRSRRGLLAGLLVGVLTQPAMAIEDVIVVEGADAAAAAESRRESLHTAMREYMQAVKEEMRDSLEHNLRQRPVLELQLAASEFSTRG